MEKGKISQIVTCCFIGKSLWVLLFCIFSLLTPAKSSYHRHCSYTGNLITYIIILAKRTNLFGLLILLKDVS